MTANGDAPAHKGLLEALLAVQREAPTLPKDKVNPAFKSKYAPLDTIVETIGPVLNRHGLVWLALPTTNEQGQPALNYRLEHAASGEVREGTMPLLLSKPDAQGLGSSLTYARRQSLCAVLNLVADDDDDGNAAVQRRPADAGSDAPTAAQMTQLGRQVRSQRPPTRTLKAMLANVGVDVSDEEVENGSWAKRVTRRQVSGLLDVFASTVLPTGDSDIPSDLDPPPVVPAGDDLPFSV